MNKLDLGGMQYLVLRYLQAPKKFHYGHSLLLGLILGLYLWSNHVQPELVKKGILQAQLITLHQQQRGIKAQAPDIGVQILTLAQLLIWLNQMPPQSLSIVQAEEHQGEVNLIFLGQEAELLQINHMLAPSKMISASLILSAQPKGPAELKLRLKQMRSAKVKHPLEMILPQSAEAPIVNQQKLGQIIGEIIDNKHKYCVFELGVEQVILKEQEAC